MSYGWNHFLAITTYDQTYVNKNPNKLVKSLWVFPNIGFEGFKILMLLSIAPFNQPCGSLREAYPPYSNLWKIFECLIYVAT